MQQNATDSELSPQKETALTSLMAGASITDAATAAGVDRTTLHRWMRYDDEFVAELNRRRNEYKESVEIRLMSLADAAVTRVHDAVESGDARTAISLLKGLGLLNGPPKIGPTNASTLQLDRLMDSA